MPPHARLLVIAKVLNGSKYCGKAADCWSVGATLFTMLAGFSPFKADEAEVREIGSKRKIIKSKEVRLMSLHKRCFSDGKRHIDVYTKQPRTTFCSPASPPSTIAAT